MTNDAKGPDQHIDVDEIPGINKDSVEARLLWLNPARLDDLIAFSLYFKQKREWERAFTERKQSPPNAEQQEVFDLAFSEARIEALKGDARAILSAYSREISSKALNEYEKKTANGRSYDFFRAIYLNTIGNIVTIVICSYFDFPYSYIHRRHLQVVSD